MNTCGYEKGITSNFTSEDPNILEKEYMFSEWYDIIKNIIYTPRSFVMKYKDLFNGKIDELISDMNNKECFARLDNLSSKPIESYKNSEEIIKDFETSIRTQEYFKKGVNIIIREYLLFTNGEFRCYIIDKKFRGISSEIFLNGKQIEELKEIINKITFYTEYDDYCVDFTYYENKLLLIEINTPVWLFGCSGLFDLNVVYDYEILCGKYIPDVIDYPVIRINNEDDEN